MTKCENTEEPVLETSKDLPDRVAMVVGKAEVVQEAWMSSKDLPAGKTPAAGEPDGVGMTSEQSVRVLWSKPRRDNFWTVCTNFATMSSGSAVYAITAVSQPKIATRYVRTH